MNSRGILSTTLPIILAVVLVSSAGTGAFAQSSSADAAVDGLERVDSKKLDALYWKPGASLAGYKRVKILEPFISFKKNWQQDQNRGPGVNRVNAEDMERIQKILAEEFMKAFRKELQEKGGYDIVDEVGDDVLLLRPAIINLDVNAPDISTPGRTSSYVTSAGEMTLYMELFDSATNSIIGRVVDRREGMDTGQLQIANSVTNRSEASRILRNWANKLRKALDTQWSAER